MNLLHIDSSILGENSVSRQVSAAVVEKLTQDHPDATVVYRDLAADPVPHLSGAYLGAQSIAPAEHSPELQHDLAISSQVLEEFLAASVIVIGAPMYNFTIPSTLKAWLDRLVVAGTTFRYIESGVEGLAGDKKVIVASARGGVYSEGTQLAALDHQETYLRAVLGFIGITNITIVRAEGMLVSAIGRDKALAAAEEQIAALQVEEASLVA